MKVDVLRRQEHKLVREKSPRDLFYKRLSQQKTLLLALLPAAAAVIAFSYVPMYGIMAAFQDFDIMKGYFGSRFVGLTHFKEIFADPAFFKVTLFTLQITFIKIVGGICFQVLLALLLNEVTNKFFKKFAQSVYLLPYFLSWVVVSGLAYRILDSDGPVNAMLSAVFHVESIQFMADAGYFVPIAIISDLWKNSGYSMIIYLSALTAIDPQLYEAAKIDGAGKLKMTWYITLRCLAPVIIMMFILSIGYLMTAGFDQIFNLQNSIIRDETHTLDTFIFQVGLRRANYSFGVAAGLFQGLISTGLVLLANYLSQKYTEVGLYK